MIMILSLNIQQENLRIILNVQLKYISFTVPFKKTINDKKIKYRIRISDSYRFMQDSLSNLVDNLSELKINKIDNDVLIKRFYNTYQLCDNDINQFNLLLRKGIYSYE